MIEAERNRFALGSNPDIEISLQVSRTEVLRGRADDLEMRGQVLIERPIPVTAF